MRIGNNQTIVRNRAHEVVKLGLNGGEVSENIRVVKFQIVQNHRAWTVVYKLAAFVKKRSIVFIGLNHEKRIIGQTRRNPKIIRHTANQETRIQTRIFKQPRQHRTGGGFAVRARHREHPFTV